MNHNNSSSAVDRPESGSRVPLTLAITGGKGGVGKTQVALNLALVLARQGYRTLLLDGDVELANVNVMLGVYPGMTLEHVVLGERTLDEVLLPVTENLDLLPGASGVPGCLELDSARREDFLAQLRTLEQGYDRVIIDTAAGLSTPALHMVAASHLATLVITPDPTSLTDAFSLVKVLHRKGYRRTPSVIVNMARGATEAQTVYRRFSTAVSRYIGVQLHYLGAIWRDETIAQSISTQRPVAMMDDSDPSCRQFWTLADMLAVRCSQGVAPANGFARYWGRLVRRRHQQRSEQQPQKAVATGSNREWLASLGERLHRSQGDPLSRYRLVTGILETLGESVDEDAVEALQTGLAAMNWEEAPVTVRRAASEHFRQLARVVAPPEGLRPEEGRALGAGADASGEPATEDSGPG
jgi:MinD-like ATPase involved in chromosome partitioning or flagellar assembly